MDAFSINRNLVKPEANVVTKSCTQGAEPLFRSTIFPFFLIINRLYNYVIVMCFVLVVDILLDFSLCDAFQANSLML